MKYSITRRLSLLPVLVAAAWTVARGQSAVDPLLPTVAPGLTVQLFAQEPLVRNPAAMAFALVYTAEHYVVDILLGWAYALVAVWVVHRVADRTRAGERRWRSRFQG